MGTDPAYYTHCVCDVCTGKIITSCGCLNRPSTSYSGINVAVMNKKIRRYNKAIPPKRKHLQY